MLFVTLLGVGRGLEDVPALTFIQSNAEEEDAAVLGWS
jgi:hypothetical protein